MSALDEKTLNIYNAKSNADKAINSLKGILLGINLDGEVNEKEINELHNWAINHKELVNRNPFNEFMNIIAETVSNNLPAKETVEDLYWACQEYESHYYFYDGITTDLQTLQGICHGILSDGVINDDEIFGFHKWLRENKHLRNYYPYDEISSLILQIVHDKKIDDDEKKVLKAYFSQFIQIKDESVSNKIKEDVSKIDIMGLCTSDPDIIFNGKTFCITGVLKRGNRTQIQKDIFSLGGNVVPNVNATTDYLIVGDNGNKSWAFACYGRKVQKALEMRKSGHKIMIIHEFDFSDILDDSK